MKNLYQHLDCVYNKKVFKHETMIFPTPLVSFPRTTHKMASFKILKTSPSRNPCHVTQSFFLLRHPTSKFASTGGNGPGKETPRVGILEIPLRYVLTRSWIRRFLQDETWKLWRECNKNGVATIPQQLHDSIVSSVPAWRAFVGPPGGISRSFGRRDAREARSWPEEIPSEFRPLVLLVCSGSVPVEYYVVSCVPPSSFYRRV